MFNEEPKTGTEGEGGGEGGGGGEHQTDPRDEAIAKLTSQVENLTKGIASYRDEAQSATAAAKEAKEAAEAAAAAKKPEVKLDPKDEEKFRAWAEANGVVTKDELTAERVRIAAEAAKSVQSTAVSEFLEKHPEYDDDEKWRAVDEEFKLYKTPTDLAGFRKLLDKIHKDLGGGDSETDRARAEAKADLLKRNRLSLGGRGGGGAGDGNDNDVDKLMAKYPNLSREQITQRLSEISALYPKK